MNRKEAIEAAFATAEGPSSWPLKWRRVFIATLPISGPLLILYWVLFIMFVVAFGALYVPAAWVYDMWTKNDLDMSNRT